MREYKVYDTLLRHRRASRPSRRKERERNHLFEARFSSFFVLLRLFQGSKPDRQALCYLPPWRVVITAKIASKKKRKKKTGLCPANGTTKPLAYDCPKTAAQPPQGGPGGAPDVPTGEADWGGGGVSTQEDGNGAFARRVFGDRLTQYSSELQSLRFQSRLTDSRLVEWEAVLWRSVLLVEVPVGILPDGSKESFVNLLDYAEEKLQCETVLICFKKDRTDRASLIRVFMFMGLEVVAPGHPDVPDNPDYFFMAYSID